MFDAAGRDHMSALAHVRDEYKASQNEVLDIPELCTGMIDKVESYTIQYNDVAHRVVWTEAHQRP